MEGEAGETGRGPPHPAGPAGAGSRAAIGFADSRQHDVSLLTTYGERDG